MEEKNNSLIEVEDFNFKINTRTSTVSIPALLSYLENYNTLAKSINHVLNKNGCAGYDQVIVEIEAFQHGSFNIFGHIKKITENPTFAAVGSAVVTALISKALNSDPAPLVINNYQGGEITINYTELVANKDILKARSRIARTATSDKNVESITFSFSQTGQEEKATTISLSELQALIIDEDLSEQQTIKSKYGNAILRIISPVLESKPATWKVEMDGRKISANMVDVDFLNLMDENNIAFGKGDVIIAELEAVINENDGIKSSPKYYIRKVNKYPKYSKSEPKDITLF